MKKFLNLLMQTFLITGTSLTIVGCHDPLASGSAGPAVPPKPIIKDVQYYQNLIEERVLDVIDCNKMLEEIKDSKDDYDNQEDYQAALDEVTAEQYHLKAEINEYQYQILLLNQQDDKFTPAQVLVGITIFTEKVNNLAQEFALKMKYCPDNYSESELRAIFEEWTTAQKFLQKFVSLKED